MAWLGRDRDDAAKGSGPMLVVDGLDVFYGRAHALQRVSFELARGVLGIVGRNGMGKTTLCNAITGLIAATGSVKLAGEEILGMAPNKITQRGIAYVPQGRRVWPSLTVDETLRLVARHRREIERVYSMFPRLAERKGHGGGQLSGGEQQMLAIGRALLLEPRLLVMDEPTEGLAPVIVEQVTQALRALATESDIVVLLIEQNLGVAIDVADNIAVMVNGRLDLQMPAAALAADRDLQERLLGVRAGGPDEVPEAADVAPVAAPPPAQVMTVRRAYGDGAPSLEDPSPRSTSGFNRWNSGAAVAPLAPVSREPAAPAPPALPEKASAQLFDFPVAASSGRAAYVAGTFDTKSRELLYLRQCLERRGLRVITVDLATSGKTSSASVHPREVARHHPQGEAAVFGDDRGKAVSAMAIAFERYIRTRSDVGGIIGAGGSGGTSLATPAMRALPIGVPKLMVSSVASGDTRPYVGPSDICMMYSVTDVQGINRISEKVLGNAAHALAGMMAHPITESTTVKPALGLTMFGVTTPCVQAVAKRLGEQYDCLVFHATGVGGQSMEKLADSGLLAGVIDVSTTEVADEIVGGVLSAGPHRMDVYARHDLPYVGSCGALDMVNFGVWDSVPERFKGRKLYRHNPTITLMRTTPDECRAIGEFIATKLNAMRGPVRFLIPEGGVSAIDKPGQPFHEPEADRALFTAIEHNFRPTATHRLQRLPLHINDEAFADALVAAWSDVSGSTAGVRRA
jgi:uncharacterized protein (UPF0261 family)/ABC-type branched-subunit amino acid transport system ATPase component